MTKSNTNGVILAKTASFISLGWWSPFAIMCNCTLLTPREEAVNDTGHYSCIYSYFFTGLYNRTLNITLPPAQHCCHIITNHDEILNFGLFMVQFGLFGPRSEDTNHLIHQCFNENQTGWDHWNGLFHVICYWISHLMGQTAQGWLFRS